MGVDHDVVPQQYIVARMAQWAGDFDFAAKLYGNIGRADYDLDAEDASFTPQEIMSAAAKLRREQILARIEEFENLRREGDLGDLTYQPLVLTTSHLRGAVWRLGPRWFQLRAYMTELSWASELKGRAKRHLNAPGSIQGGTDGAGTWSMTGNPFITATLSDRCLLHADAYWASPNFPKSAEPFVEKFQRILASLDEEHHGPRGQVHD